MNYEEQVRDMLRHAATNSQTHVETVDAMGQVIEALGKGIAIISLGLPEHEVSGFIMQVASAIAVQRRVYQAEHGSEIDAATFLRDHFHPEKFHG